MLASVRFAVRSFARRPSIAIVAVVSLAIGIGVNSAVFGIVDAFLRPPAVEHPEGLVTVSGSFRDSGDTVISWPDYQDIASQIGAFPELAAFSQRGALYRDGDDVIQLPLTVVSDNYFSVLGVRPALGRFPEPGYNYDSDPTPPITISHSFWRKRLGGRADVIGQSVELTKKLFRVAAVLPPEFRGFSPVMTVEIWMPVGAWTKNGKEELQRGNGQFEAIGRLRAGISLQQAQAGLDPLAKRIEQTDSRVPRGRRLVAQSLGDQLHSRTRPGLLVLAAVALVLLTACANVAGVLLAHAESRRREIGIRMAIGASRGALARQFLDRKSVV